LARQSRLEQPLARGVKHEGANAARLVPSSLHAPCTELTPDRHRSIIA
jgi:hypothetical protein